MEHDPSIWSTILALIISIGVFVGFCFTLFVINQFFKKHSSWNHGSTFYDDLMRK